MLGLGVRHGAMVTNPVRDIERIDTAANMRPRALTDDERRTLVEQHSADPEAVAADLSDLTRFMLATGVRIGEALGLRWDEVDLPASEVEISHQVMGVKSWGLVRTKTNTHAGERTLGLPTWSLDMLRARCAE